MTDYTRSLTSLSNNIKTLTAKMFLLKSEIASSLQTLPESSQNSIFETYDSIGQGLHSLMQDWQTGRTDLLRLFPSNNQDTDVPNEDEGSIADSGVGTGIPEYDPLNKRISCGDWGFALACVTSPGPDELPEIGEETEIRIFERTARGRIASGGGLSRQERIEWARREREEGAERKRIAMERTMWVGELKDVLGRRNR